MRKLYLLIGLFIYTLGMTQIPQPNKIYYPNTVNTPTDVLMGSTQYLCGPNTIVYDTLGHGCSIYVSSNSTLTLKPNCSMCVAATKIYLQGNSVLNFLSGNCNNYYVAYEPSVTINNPYNITYSSATFTSISWPTVNCVANGIKSNNLDNEKIMLYPNPANDELNISFSQNPKFEVDNIIIYNSIGQLMREEELSFKNNTAFVNTSNLPNGVYLLKLLNSTRNDNMGSLSKRFTINR